MVVVFIVLFVSSLAAGALAQRKNRNGFAWALTGFFYGPVGVLMIAVETTLPPACRVVAREERAVRA
ncbi:MAG TPA: hypothetical protein VGM90_02670 [Kofleriaceae bacterium]|jgi:hypothetical protein